jgi:hypothetical protein
MNKKSKSILAVSAISLIVLGVLFTNGCVKQQNISNANNNSSIANPASVYCIKNNGTLEIRNNEAGQYGVCIKNEKECEEWTYYRGECVL